MFQWNIRFIWRKWKGSGPYYPSCLISCHMKHSVFLFILWCVLFLYKHCRSGEWGDHVTLQAAADRVHSTFKMADWFLWVKHFYLQVLAPFYLVISSSCCRLSLLFSVVRHIKFIPNDAKTCALFFLRKHVLICVHSSLIISFKLFLYYAQLSYFTRESHFFNWNPFYLLNQYAAKICLLTSFRDTCLVEIVPRDATPTRG